MQELSSNNNPKSSLSQPLDKFSVFHPRFGRLRRDNFHEVEKALIGDREPDPILVPVVLDYLFNAPIPSTSFANAITQLRKLCDNCSILLQQTAQIKNAHALAGAASQSGLTCILPFPPLPFSGALGTNEYYNAPITRSQQVDIVHLLLRLTRIYVCSTEQMEPSRNLNSTRSTTLATVTCITDKITRILASDDPSIFSLHYSGKEEGPVDSFGITSGSFESLGSSLPTFSPILALLRSQCLEYFYNLSEHTISIFNFDDSPSPTENDLKFIKQLSTRLALVRPDFQSAANLISGKDGSITEILPEFAYMRDIVFYFKHSVSGFIPDSSSSSKQSREEKEIAQANVNV
jgi:hypothetical protein